MPRCRWGEERLSKLVSVWVQVALSLGFRSSANQAGEEARAGRFDVIRRTNAVVGEIHRTARTGRRVAIIDRAAFVAGATLGAVMLVLAGMPVAQVIARRWGSRARRRGWGG